MKTEKDYALELLSDVVVKLDDICYKLLSVSATLVEDGERGAAKSLAICAAEVENARRKVSEEFNRKFSD